MVSHGVSVGLINVLQFLKMRLCSIWKYHVHVYNGVKLSSKALTSSFYVPFILISMNILCIMRKMKVVLLQAED